MVTINRVVREDLSHEVELGLRQREGSYARARREQDPRQREEQIGIVGWGRGSFMGSRNRNKVGVWGEA